VLLAPLPGQHRADQARWRLNEMIATLPLELRKSIAWDRGSEMAQHARFTIEPGIPIYFCDPQSPWQRGTNEALESQTPGQALNERLVATAV
jgi:IS30 family transposase